MRATTIIAITLAAITASTTWAQRSRSAALEWEQRARDVPCQNYALQTDLSDQDASVIADSMDQFMVTCSGMFSELDGRPSTGDQLCVFASQDDYMAWLHHYLGVDGTGSAGMFLQLGDRRALVAWKGEAPLPQLLGTLRHEGFHHIASTTFPNLPPWANEGIAEMFERAVPVSNGLAMGNVRSRDVIALQRAVKEDDLIPLNRFFRIEPRNWNHAVRRGDAQIQYLQAWAIIQFLLYGEEGKYKEGFISFLRDMNAGEGWQTAFTNAYGVRNYALLEKKFIDFIETLRPSDLESVIPRMVLMGEGLKSLSQRGERIPDANTCAGRLRSDGFQCPLPPQYGGGTVSTGMDNPFKLGDESGGRLVFADANGRPLQGYAPRPNILATGLGPRELLLRWLPDDTWEVLVDN
ncbi:MAG: DUF1570 domain-containing protein [Phycisphaerales bacterium]|nr:DUF1570 domain-containing protein [Phycisphaerales bacterium]